MDPVRLSINFSHFLTYVIESICVSPLVPASVLGASLIGKLVTTAQAFSQLSSLFAQFSSCLKIGKCGYSSHTKNIRHRLFHSIFGQPVFVTPIADVLRNRDPFDLLQLLTLSTSYLHLFWNFDKFFKCKLDEIGSCVKLAEQCMGTDSDSYKFFGLNHIP